MANPKWIFPIVAFLIMGNLHTAQCQSNYTTLASFVGQIPISLTLDDQGNIFGTTLKPGLDYGIITTLKPGLYIGNVFEIKKGSQTFNTIASFQNELPDSIALDGSENIFGTTSRIAWPARATIFEIVKGSHIITTLETIYKAAFGKLTLDAQGNIFGTIRKFNEPSQFSVFELKKGDHTVTHLASLIGDGNNGSDRLCIDSHGNIFATNINLDLMKPIIKGADASIKNGSIFKINSVSHQVSVLIIFHGKAPNWISRDINGNIYGCISNYPRSTIFSHSTIFKFRKGAHNIIPLATFYGFCSDLILDQNGNIFGMDYVIGKKNMAIIFKLAKDTHSVIKLATFQGDRPQEIIFDGSGSIFGRMNSFPSKNGTIFEIPHDGKGPGFVR